VRKYHPFVEGMEARSLLSSMMAGPMQPALALRPTLVGQLSTAQESTISTIPPNGDVNPYGIAFVPRGFPRGGSIQTGDLLISNFNAKSNLQGTGTTIVKISPDGTKSVFFQAQQGVGLTTAL